MRHWQWHLTACGLLALAGCGGMSANECELADWEAVGYADGARGRTADAFDQRRQSCAKHAVAPDFKAYQAGREAGLREYCQPANGYRVGSGGQDYAGVCPPTLEGDFYQSYLDGRMLYDLRAAVSKTSRQITANKARMNAIEKELTDQAMAQLTGDLTSDQRARMIVEAQQLIEERVTLDNETDHLEKTLERQKAELAEYEDELVAQR